MPGDAYYQSREWKALRLRRLRLDGYRCVICGEPANIVDHRISRRRWLAEGRPGSPDTIENTRSLDRICDNRIKEGRGGARRNAGRSGAVGADGFPLAE